MIHPHPRLPVPVVVGSVVALSLLMLAGCSAAADTTDATDTTSDARSADPLAETVVRASEDNRIADALDVCESTGTNAATNYAGANEFELAASFPTTSASYADWQHTGRANTQEVQAPDEGADLAALCYFVGEFEVAIPQPPGGIEIHQTLLSIIVTPTDGAALVGIGDINAIRTSGMSDEVLLGALRPPVG